MKYFVETEGRTFELDLQEQGDQLIVRIGDRQISVDLRQVTVPSLYSMLIENNSYELLVESREEEYAVQIGAELFQVRVQDEWTRRLANIQRRGDTETGEVTIKAPMPGAVIAVEVEVGQEVAKGQGVVILSAMKMENEIKSPRAGRVKSIEVQAGQTVEQGRTLVVVE